MTNHTRYFISKFLFSVLLLIVPFISQAQFRVVGYLPNWNSFLTKATNLDWDKLTHVNIAFINPDASGNLSPDTDLAAVVALAHSHNVKILISLGGATAPAATYANLLLPANRAAFVTKINQFVQTYDLDGVDVDLEGNAVSGNYQDFVVDLKAVLQPQGKLLTAAVGQWFSNSISSTALAQFDFVNIMAYDYSGSWAPQNPGPHSSYERALEEMDFWADRGIPTANLVMGVPFYGYNFNGTSANSSTYNSITSSNPGSENYDVEYTTGTWAVFYNGIPTIKKKAQYAMDHYGGIMIWELTQDAPNAKSLLTAIDSVITHHATNVVPTVTITGPSDNHTVSQGTDVTITADATDPDNGIMMVEFYAGTFKIGTDFSAPYSIDWKDAAAGTYNVTAIAYDSIAASDTMGINVIINSVAQTFLGAAAWPVPGKVEAEDFDFGASGMAYYDNTTGNSGGEYRAGNVDIQMCLDLGAGYNISHTVGGEWLEYTLNVASTGFYDIQVRVATNSSSVRTFYIEIDGVNVTGTMSTTAAGGWQYWRTVTAINVPLTAGTKVMRFVSNNGNINLNYINFAVATPVTMSESSSGNIVLYPVPVEDHASLKISSETSGDLEVEVSDVFGKVVMTKNYGRYNSGEQIISVEELNALPAGIYLLRVYLTDGVEQIRFVKK